jgi:hypothetical protein
MRRLAFALLLALTPLATAASPADAHTEACTGTGVIFVSGSSFSGGVGLCTAALSPATISGSFVGSFCLRAQGSINVNGHTALFVTAGGVMVIGPGGANGTIVLVPQIIGDTCVIGSSRYLAVANVVLI